MKERALFFGVLRIVSVGFSGRCPRMNPADFSTVRLLEVSIT
ncbi:hypothetical protein HMPREF9439_00315 [Parasutterella excrementihominis YIT 11859]|uniref:Uncharacterized protein n=1 Tax=Parasutterella excrementihominis YIT 11859 TaxID=762966 RepID=F3QHC2_9BURK|nr:hypothetical protein HMPREF9439_00315 [Parasutterella excrementihominis YIT 11859]